MFMKTLNINSRLLCELLLVKKAQEISDPIADAICGLDNCNPYSITSSKLEALRGIGWLSDAIINAVKCIISHQFPVCAIFRMFLDRA